MKDFTWGRAVYYFLLKDFVGAFKLALKYFFKPKVTINYPHEKGAISPRFRGEHALRCYPNGEERCIACKLCSAVCPAQAITIESEERDDGTRRTTSFEIDAFKCIYCGFCEEACPVDSIVETNIFEYHMTENQQRIQTKEMLLATGDKYRDQTNANKKKDSTYK